MIDPREPTKGLARGMALLCAMTVIAGCAAMPPSKEEQSPRPAKRQHDRSFSMLAGEWEYEEGSAVIGLSLDQQGRGRYPFKGGQLVTTSLVDHEWRGRWLQPENDREGGFVVHLTADFSEGDGQWWYTRIGSITSPPDPGGTFHMTRAVDDLDPLSKRTATRP